MILSMIAMTAMPSALPRMVPPAPCHDLLSAEPTFGARATTAARTDTGLGVDTSSAHLWQAGTAPAPTMRAPQLALRIDVTYERTPSTSPAHNQAQHSSLMKCVIHNTWLHRTAFHKVAWWQSSFEAAPTVTMTQKEVEPSAKYRELHQTKGSATATASAICVADSTRMTVYSCICKRLRSACKRAEVSLKRSHL